MGPEVGFVMDFDVDPKTNMPTGCGPLDADGYTPTNTAFAPGTPIQYKLSSLGRPRKVSLHIFDSVNASR